jgi:hypothetical protein
MVAIIDLLSRRVVAERARPAFAVLAIYTALLLPTNALALKTFTYDAFSLALGALAVILLLFALQESRPRLALWGVLAAFLAAQEKMVVAPVLLLALAVYGALKGIAAPPGKRALRAVGFTLLAAGLALLLSLGEALLVAAMRDWAGLSAFLSGVLDPLIGWAWPFIALTLGGSVSRGSALALAALSLGLAVGLALLLIRAGRFLQPRQARLSARLEQASWLLLLFFVLCGLAGILFIKPYLAPFQPIAEGDFTPPVFNFVVQHYGARTAAGSIAAHTAYLYAIALGDIPTVFWLMALIGWLASWQARRAGRAAPPAVSALLIMGALMPLAFGLAQMPWATPLSSRYVNLGMAFLALALLAHFASGLAAWRPVERLGSWGHSAIALALAALLTLEVLPFAPLYGPFDPFWLHASSADPRPGGVDRAWWGWGEELMLAGREVQSQCQPDEGGVPAETGPWSGQRCADIRLHTVFQSRWLGGDPIRTDVYLFDPHEYGETDYYLISRTAVVLWGHDLPGIEPVLALDYRGYPFAWVYRGSELAAAGIALP